MKGELGGGLIHPGPTHADERLPVGWCCLVSSFFWCGVAVFPFPFGGVVFHFFLFVGLRSPTLLLGGAAWSPPSAFFFPLFLRGAAWFLPSEGGVAVFPSPFGGAALLPFLWVRLRSPLFS